MSEEKKLENVEAMEIAAREALPEELNLAGEMPGGAGLAICRQLMEVAGQRCGNCAYWDKRLAVIGAGGKVTCPCLRLLDEEGRADVYYVAGHECMEGEFRHSREFLRRYGDVWGWLYRQAARWKKETGLANEGLMNDPGKPEADSVMWDLASRMEIRQCCGNCKFWDRENLAWLAERDSDGEVVGKQQFGACLAQAMCERGADTVCMQREFDVCNNSPDVHAECCWRPTDELRGKLLEMEREADDD